MSEYRAKKTVKLAPDALVFFQGQESIVTCTQCQKFTKVANDVTSWSVSLPIEGISSATINLATPRHDPTRWWSNGKPRVKPLTEVEIYARGRFNIQGTQEPAYYPVFWGIVTKVTRSYAQGKSSVSVSCQGMLRWWEMSKINVNPSLFDSSTFPGITPTVFANSFKELNPLQIAYVLNKLTTGGLLGVRGINDPAVQDSRVSNTLRSLDAEVKDYWQNRFSRIGRALRVVAPDADYFTSEDIESSIPDIFCRQKSSDSSHAAGQSGISRQTGEVQRQRGANPLDQTALVENYLPYFSLSTPQLFQSNITSKLEIMNEVKNNIQYEFYQDSTGEIFFKPPFYNLNTKEYPPFVIKDEDIISFDFDEDEAAVFTRVDVQGSWMGEFSQAAGLNGSSVPRAYHVDPQLLKEYGLRGVTLNNASLVSPDSCYLFAIGELDRLNAQRLGGNVVIMGRPEMRLGYPVFIESENTFYYVTNISHNFSFGGTFTTTLGLTAARRQILEEQTGKPARVRVFKGTNNPVSSNASTPARNDVLATAGQAICPTGDEVATAQEQENQASVTSNENPADRSSPTRSIARGFTGTFSPIPIADADIISVTYTQKADVAATSATRELRFPYTDEEGYEHVGGFAYGRNVKLDANGTLTLRDNPQTLENEEGTPAITGSLVSTLGRNRTSEVKARQKIVQTFSEGFNNNQDVEQSGPKSIPYYALESGNSGLAVAQLDGSKVNLTKISPDTFILRDDNCRCEETDTRDRLTIAREESRGLAPLGLATSDEDS